MNKDDKTVAKTHRSVKVVKLEKEAGIGPSKAFPSNLLWQQKAQSQTMLGDAEMAIQQYCKKKERHHSRKNSRIKNWTQFK